MAYEIELAEGAQRELEALRVFDHRQVLDAVEVQLKDQPTQEMRNRKNLGDGMTADFEYVPPLWELRIGEFRVFYNVNEQEGSVTVYAVRRKPPDKTTAEVLDAGS